MVSRLHAEIRNEGGHWYLTDAGSRHGTLLNGQTISAATEIQSGAIIQLGPNGPIINVELIDDAPAPITPTFSETFIDDEAAQAQAALRVKAQIHPGVEPAAQTPVETPIVQEQKSDYKPAPSQPRPAPTPSAPAAQKPVPVLICQSGSSTQVGSEYVLNSDEIGRASCRERV